MHINSNPQKPSPGTVERLLSKQIRIGKSGIRNAPFELTLCALLSVFIPSSLATPWGAAGSYVCLGLSLIAMIGIIRSGPSLASLFQALPILFILIVLSSTAAAIINGSFRADYVRGTPAQLFAFIMIFTLSRIWRNMSQSQEHWMKCFIIVSLFVSMIAIAEYVAKDYFEFDRMVSNILEIQFDDSLFRRDPDSFRSISTFGNPLFLGTFAAVMSTISFGFYLQSKRFFFLISFITNMAATFVTLSRSSWLALAVGIMTVVILQSNKRCLLTSRQYIHIGLVFLLAALLLMLPILNSNRSLISDLFDIVAQRGAELNDSISYTHRLASPGLALTSMTESPVTLFWGFGIGGENKFFIDVFGVLISGVPSNDVMFIRTFDNTYVTVSYCFGIIGLFYFLWLIFRSYACIKITRYNNNLWHRAAIIVLVVSILFYNAFAAPLVIFLLALFLGLAPPQRDHHNNRRQYA
jgi:hypothetical protein